MERCVLLKFGELALKGRNRWRFEDLLRRNLRHAMSDLEDVEVHRRASVFAVGARVEMDALVERARTVIGVSLINPALVLDRTADAAARAAVDLLRDQPAGSFAIRARRRDKRFELRSHELASLVGAAVQRELGLDVDLSNPDATVYLEVDTREIFAYTERIPGPGGLPVGISGRAVVLLSGGIDSPVAAYRMLKRGLRCDFIHFSGRPFTGPESIYKAYAQVRRLDRYQGDSRLCVVPFGRAQRALANVGAGRLQVLAQRRLMVRVATELARRRKAEAVVTGDSLGQVSSQTLPNMALVDAASDLPVLRPLLDRDKQEIVEAARELGTLDVSILPDEDCCTLFASGGARTRAAPAELAAIERRLDDIDAMVDGLLEHATVVAPGSPEGAAAAVPAAA